MREVSVCDFCDEEAAGTFEVVPPERDPAGEGRRLVLCPDCRDTLGATLEPLVERSADTAAPAETGTGTTTVVAEPGDRPDGSATDPANAGADPDEGAGQKPAMDGAPSGGDGAGTSPGSGDVEGSGRQGATRRGAPSGYRKVMRFLENRDFPMDREEAETLVAEAYEMDPETVSSAVDHAIRHGRLREVGGDLHQ